MKTGRNGRIEIKKQKFVVREKERIIFRYNRKLSQVVVPDRVILGASCGRYDICQSVPPFQERTCHSASRSVVSWQLLVKGDLDDFFHHLWDNILIMEALNSLISEVSSEVRLSHTGFLNLDQNGPPENIKTKQLWDQSFEQEPCLADPTQWQLISGKKPICLKFSVGTEDLSPRSYWSSGMWLGKLNTW